MLDWCQCSKFHCTDIIKWFKDITPNWTYDRKIVRGVIEDCQIRIDLIKPIWTKQDNANVQVIPANRGWEADL